MLSNLYSHIFFIKNKINVMLVKKGYQNDCFNFFLKLENFGSKDHREHRLNLVKMIDLLD